jgi:hypothetical protein
VVKAVKYILTLGAALACVSALAGAIAARRIGSSAFEASAVAAGLNWVAGSLALATVFATRHSPHRINGALLAMASRMALPLLAVVYFTRSQHPLVGGGVVGFIVIGYLVGLVIETIMAVRLVSPDGGVRNRSAH